MAENECDPRLGELNDDGSVKTWPQTDVKGGVYPRPPGTTMGFGTHGFVVLPYGDCTEALARLEADLARPPVTQKRYESSKKTEVKDDAPTDAT